MTYNINIYDIIRESKGGVIVNFVYISPSFPKNFFHFCDRLKNKGVTVLAIGDTTYGDLTEALRTAKDDYY